MPIFRLEQVSLYIESSIGIRAIDVDSERAWDHMTQETVIRFVRPV